MITPKKSRTQRTKFSLLQLLGEVIDRQPHPFFFLKKNLLIGGKRLIIGFDPATSHFWVEGTCRLGRTDTSLRVL